MALGTRRTWALILAFPLVQASDETPTECECCSTLNVLANEECQTAYADAGLPENGRCKDWEVVKEPCLDTCDFGTYPSCTDLSGLLFDACYPIMELVNSPEYANATCGVVRDNFIRRCNVACADKEELCKPGTLIDTCMGICGNYRDCNCYDVEGTFMTTCEGAVQEVFLYEDCYDLLDNPNLTICTDGPCADFSVCPLNLCIVHRVECDPETECWNEGVCQPDTGECTYTAKDYGTPCDDGNPYSYHDKCTGYAFDRHCTGEMDKCQQYQLTCEPLNVCQVSGSCSSETGDCANKVKPDGTSCDDGKSWTNNDQCMRGVCMGEEENLCTELFNRGDCQNVPCVTVTCDPRDGVCLRKYLNGNADQVCGDHATCVEGRCMKPSKGTYADIGTGVGTDADGRTLPGYYGDVGNIDKCLLACDHDPVCVGIGYSVSSSSCMVYAPNRTFAPNGEKLGGHSVWAWVHGNGGTELEQATPPPEANVPVVMVFKRVDSLGLLDIDHLDLLLGPPGIMVGLLALFALYSMFNVHTRKSVLRSLGCERFSWCRDYLKHEIHVDEFGKEFDDSEEDEPLPGLEDLKNEEGRKKFLHWVPGFSLFNRFRRAQHAYDEEVEKAYEEMEDYIDKVEEEARARAEEEAADEAAAAHAVDSDSDGADAVEDFGGGAAASGSSYDSSSKPVDA
jgi:hypothetical protein